jgi:colanic acid/amylovoran biosynthesis glycosyltransferase
MGVAVFVKTYPKRSETFIKNQVDFLGAKVFCQSHGDISNAEWHDKPDVVLGNTTFIIKCLRKLLSLFNIYYDPLSSSQKLEMRVQLENHKIKKVLIQYGPNAIKVSDVCRENKIQSIIHFHGYDLSSMLCYYNYKNLLKDAIGNATAVIVVNSIQKKILIDDLKIEKEKINVIPCGVSIENFRPKDVVKDEFCNFLMVGRLVEKKQPLISIKAFELCCKANKNVRLSIVGEGPLKGQIAKHISTSTYKDKISYLGAQNPEQIKILLNKSDVFIQHSVISSNGDSEGWPISIAEACASGLPVVSTKHSGISDQIKHKINGFLVDEFDYNEMADYMKTLSFDINLRQKMGLLGIERIKKIGSLKNQLKLLNILINKIN